MNWKVTYRGKDGKPAEEFVEAESRDALFKTLAARGIRVIRTEEVREPIDRRNARSKRPLVWGIVGVSVAVGAAVILKCQSLSEGDAEAQQKDAGVPSKAISTVTPAKPHKTEAKPSAPSVKAEQPKREMWLGREIVRTKVVTNGTDLIITRIDTEGKVHKQYTSIHKRLFSNPVDITLAILLTTPEGALTPPLPPLGPRSDDIFAESLKKPIEISEDDTPEEKRIKQLVMAAREEMLEELRNGRSVNEVIEDHCTFVDANNRLRAEAMVQYKELVAEGDEALAEQFREKANEMLVGKGAAPLKSLAEIREERISKREKKQ